jgi:large subunit ribosomal protein L25
MTPWTNAVEAPATLRVLMRPFGKNDAERERRAGRVPALLYGLGQGNLPLSVTAHELRPHARRPDFFNRVLEIELPDGAGVVRAVPRQIDRAFNDMQPSYVTFMRWPSTPAELEKNPQMVPIPTQVLNEDSGPGVKAGHFLFVIFKTWRFKVSKEPVLTSLLVDAAELNLRDRVQLSDLAIPEGHTSIPRGKLLNPTIVKILKAGSGGSS